MASAGLQLISIVYLCTQFLIASVPYSKSTNKNVQMYSSVICDYSFFSPLFFLSLPSAQISFSLCGKCTGSLEETLLSSH